MSSNTEPAKESIPSEILATISVGAMLAFTPEGDEAHYAFVVDIGGDQSAIAIDRPQGGNYTFVVTMYEYNGSNEAKISLQPLGMPGYYWVAGQSVGELINPILLGSAPGEFMLTDVGQGAISIQNTFSPPGPYLRGPVGRILSYGFDQPLLQGFFNIQVVG